MDRQQTHAQVFQLPTVIAMYQGKTINSFVGALPPVEVAKWIKALLAATKESAPAPASTAEGALEQV